jgi:hypothetical protein
MREILDILKELTQLLNWQVTTLIILIMVRKHLGLVFSGLQGLLNRTSKVVVDGKTVTVEAAATIIQEQKEEIEQKNKEIKDTSKELDDYAQGAVQALPIRVVSENLERLEPIIKTMGMEDMLSKKVKNGNQNLNDPQKGKWGGHSIAEDKKLSATVIPVENSPHLFKVTLTVVSSDKSKFLGKVTFHLHPTFINAVRTVESENGVAQLHLIAYGAFTVGVVTEDGTQLELDLSEDKSFPEVFRNN